MSRRPASFPAVVHIPRAARSPAFSPLYRQIKERMLRALGDREWTPGMMIPSENDLAARFGVSQGTVRKAIDELAAENLLVRCQGKGTFVASHCDPSAYYRFLRLQPNDGHRHRTRSTPLSCAEVPADAAVADSLRLAPGAPVIVLERLLDFGDAPVVFDQIFLAADIFAGLTLERLQQDERSLYSLFEIWFGVRMIHAEERLRAVTDAHAAGRLGLPGTYPLLLVERCTYTYGERPVEWRRGFYDTTRYHYRNILN
ncbi:MAG: GntR family transcriptional regulator [Zoogloeaceae bacterium]|jgi:GntR family transcriptional regulator|nr:GntR family transcriptional regulator [Zoogloeaceae bacterium]